MANPGDKVRISTKERHFEGLLMPNESEKSIFLKLDSGYNQGIHKDKIVKTEVLEKRKEKKAKAKEVKHKKELKKVIILHTGGTIASKVDYETGGVIAQFTAADLLEMVPEMQHIANVETELVANMMSEDMNFSDHVKVAKAIEKHAKTCDGIIIGHGTDTLGYTAASLSFIFEKINIPVIIVGSQRSSDRGSSDAAMNLICAAEFIVNSGFIGVAVCMHHSSNDDTCAILPGTKVRKMHTSRRDAFKAINDTPIALVDYKTRKINFLKKDYKKKSKDNEIILRDKFSDEVGLLKTHPNMKTELFEFFTNNYKAIIMENTGLGHAPTNLGEENLKKHKLLEDFIKNGGIVAVTSQCLFGRVHPDVYTNLRRLSNIGCIFCEDMLPETAFIKLSWLLGNYKKEEAEKLLNKNLRGEITERSLYEEEFLE